MVHISRIFRRRHSTIINAELPVFVIGLLAAVLIVTLVGVVIWATFLKGLPGVDAVFSLTNYEKFFVHPMTGKVALNTLLIGMGSMLISMFFAVPIAWLTQRTTIPGKGLILTMLYLHVLLPGFLATMGWIMLLSPDVGIINVMLRTFIPVDTGPLSPYNILSIMFLQGITLTPVNYFLIAGAFVAVDPAYEESAQACGSSLSKVLRKVTLPLLAPAILAAALYIFMASVSMFEIAQLVGTPRQIWVFSTLMYDALHPDFGLPNYGAASVYGIALLIPMLIALYFYQRMLRASYRYATVSGKGYKPKLTDLGKWTWVGVFFVFIYFLLDVIMPLVAVLWASLVPHIQVPSMAALATISPKAYASAFRTLTSGGVLSNTLILMVAVAIVVLMISLVISWIVLRTRLPGRYILDSIAMLPHGVPRVGLAFAGLFLGLTLVRVMPFFYGSLLTIVVVEIVAFTSFGTRSINSGLIQIHRDLEDAVQTLGVSRIIGLRTVVMPILSPTLFYVVTWTALMAYREVTMPLFLQSPKNVVISTSIFQSWLQGGAAEAAALGIIMVLAMSIVMGITLKLNPWGFRKRIALG